MGFCVAERLPELAEKDTDNPVRAPRLVAATGLPAEFFKKLAITGTALPEHTLVAPAVLVSSSQGLVCTVPVPPLPMIPIGLQPAPPPGLVLQPHQLLVASTFP